MADREPDDMRLHLRRPEGRVRRFARRAWASRWVKAILALGLAGLLGIAGLWVFISRDMPSVDQLRTYEPPLPTNVRGIDGTPIATYARERRVELSYAEYPPLLVRAFLAAEDRTFFQHHGVDYPGIAAAILTNLRNDGRPVGASTITQQVAKNLLLTNELSYVRKAKEAILAYRIENALTKQQILELYLNQIFLGRQAYGVEAAAHAYFDKELSQLSLPQFAFLAILPKAPSNYEPNRNYDEALKRRNWVLGEMRSNGFISDAQYAEAVATPIGAIRRRVPKFDQVGGYYVEEVRRQLLEKFGENAKDGPYSVYSGGLWVRSSFDPKLQEYAQDALRAGLLRYDRGRGWSGPLAHVEIEGDRWQSALAATNIGLSYDDWRAAIVTSRSSGEAELGFADGSTGRLPSWGAQMPVRGTGKPAFSALKTGDVIAVAPEGSSYALRSIPKISGGMVIEDPRTGRILAMQGGFDHSLQSFNRATQAMRQPGSTIKPIVYSAALEQGMTPASIIVDGPFCVYQGARLGQKCFRNFGGGGAGPHTMRWGIEQSRNLMTVRAASQTGMTHVVGLMDRMGIGKYPAYLSFALGAGETTVLRMVNAYSALVNHGRQFRPSLVDFVQDRRGNVIWPENWRACEGCNAKDWNGKAMPRPAIRARQVIDPVTAYQMVHITEGVVQRGTATRLRDMGRPLMGKTGTTSGPNDVWFVGGSPQMLGGLYIGYDEPRSLGGAAQGGTLAVPIFKDFAVKAMEKLEPLPFTAPAGVRMVRIDRASGRPVSAGWPSDDPKSAIIWEAFKPESEPRRPRRSREQEAAEAAKAVAKPTQRRSQSDSDFLQQEGGIY